MEGVKHPVKVKEDERKDEMDRLTYFYQKNGYKQEIGNARIYMKLYVFLRCRSLVKRLD